MTRILQTGAATRQAGVQLTTVIPVCIRRHGGRKWVVPAPTDAHAIAEHDPPMLTALTRAFRWQRLIEEGVMKSGSEIARREGLHPTTVNELLRLTLLSPAMVQAILAGRQPKALSLLWLKNHQLPAAWDAQQALFDALDA